MARYYLQKPVSRSLRSQAVCPVDRHWQPRPGFRSPKSSGSARAQCARARRACAQNVSGATFPVPLSNRAGLNGLPRRPPLWGVGDPSAPRAQLTRPPSARNPPPGPAREERGLWAERRVRRPRSLSLAAAASSVGQYVQENGRIWAWLRRESEGQCPARASPPGVALSPRLLLARPGEGLPVSSRAFSPRAGAAVSRRTASQSPRGKIMISFGPNFMCHRLPSIPDKKQT